MTHKHHIIPKHMGGTDDSSNLVELTVAEHAEAHRVLFEKYGLEQDRIAWLALSGQITNEEAIKLASSAAHKGTAPWNKGKSGKPHSQETLIKMSTIKKGKWVSLKTRAKMSDWQKGKPKLKPSIETRAKMSLTRRRHLGSQ